MHIGVGVIGAGSGQVGQGIIQGIFQVWTGWKGPDT